IEQRSAASLSIMPDGQLNALASRQQFLDLLRYLMEIRDGGPQRAAELEPPPALYASRPLPEYEQQIDHAGMIASLNDDSFRRGEAIYNRLCINCHGTHDKPGSLPTSLRFATGKFKNGSDPYTMYQTLTRGFGMMVPQTWMVPEQKYDVIHYIRQAYLREHNPTEYRAVDEAYLAGLPQGTTRGPQPSNILPWEQMDYGPNLVATYEVGDDGANFAYKGNAVRLDAGPGGVSQGRQWLLFDYDTLRMAAVWSGEGFIDWNGINFNGRHGVHPRIMGQVQVANPTGPGWADPRTGSFDDPRLRGRDDRAYGPLPRQWAQYRGMYYHGPQTVIAYTVGETPVWELPGSRSVELPPLSAVATGSATGDPASEGAASDPPRGRFVSLATRTFNLGSRPQPLILQVAHRPGGRIERQLPVAAGAGQANSALVFDAPSESHAEQKDQPLAFAGATRIELARPADFEMRDRDYTIAARIRTRTGGTIFAQTADQPQWVPDGKTLFVRGGKLAFDIGWVGVVTSRRAVNDGQWHNVAMVYSSSDGQVRLYIDGRADAERQLRPKQRVENFVTRIGYTAANFPGEQSFFDGQLARVDFYTRQLSADELAGWPRLPREDESLAGRWELADVRGQQVADLSGRGHDGRVIQGPATKRLIPLGPLVAGLAGTTEGFAWQDDGQGNLRLRIPAGDEPLRFTLFTGIVPDVAAAGELLSTPLIAAPDQDLASLTRGGPRRWPDELTTEAVIGPDSGPLVIDTLTPPDENPWFCQMRLTGLDFFADGDRAAVCTWDGDVWLLRGLSKLPAAAEGGGDDRAADRKPAAVPLRWKRFASGLFQPLGLKIIQDRIYVSCRDAIYRLHDLNGDSEVDFLENFNNDHQVTDHFHEFAMGLQADEQGNFYYAKSARHALPALVPQHGTLLRVSADGQRTDIVATGFRAANGVCLNPDGTFIVTDQEGHWNPKNRINWVAPGGFYGNMFGYHDVTDSSDSAMQPPLCWITNAFDRSPAELLWVDSPRWGPLQGRLLNLSYGYGKVYVVPHEDVPGQDDDGGNVRGAFKQGGMCELPIPQFPTGIMRGRFHPGDGQLYLCGMFAWGSAQQQTGGLYRLRYTGRPLHVPGQLRARPGSLEIGFTGALDERSASDPRNYQVQVWSLKRSANYGSDHLNQRLLTVAAARLGSDGRTVTLDLPDLAPTWCMEIKYRLQSDTGQPVVGTIHNTIHALGKSE
ncbi:MAG: c-type cytochrome, partial [Pirellulaceae bacterium]|nr:c-type cytochrome [Pirellulaceae bacterium]